MFIKCVCVCVSAHACVLKAENSTDAGLQDHQALGWRKMWMCSWKVNLDEEECVQKVSGEP